MCVQANLTIPNWRNLPISNPKADLHNIYAQTKFHENPLILSYHPEMKIRYVSWAGNSLKNCRKLPMSNPKPDIHYQCTYQIWWKSIEIYSSY